MKTIKYIEVTARIIEEIRSGMFKPGDCLYSRAELMRRFQVGEVTAVRIQNELAKQGFVQKVKGCGIFVTCPGTKSFAERLKEEPPKNIQSITIFRYRASEPKYLSFHSMFYQEIERRRKQIALPCTYHDYTSQQVTDTQVKILPIDHQVGYLGVSMGPVSMFYTAGIFLNPLLHNVMLDSYVPGSNAVLTDSAAGMKQLVDYAVAKGYRRFIVASNFSSEMGEFYDVERFTSACQYIRTLQLPLKMLDNGSFTDLIQTVGRESSPCCIMFMQDALALRFCHLLGKNKLKKHLVTGFDHYPGLEKPDYPVVTVAIDHAAMVNAAFDLLLQPRPLRKKIIRIPGHLVTHETEMKDER